MGNNNKEKVCIAELNNSSSDKRARFSLESKSSKTFDINKMTQPSNKSSEEEQK